MPETNFDHLAHWISEYPFLIEKVKERELLCRYLSSKPPQVTRPMVPDHMWDEIVQKLME